MSEPCGPPRPNSVVWWKSHRFYAAVAAAAGVISTTVTPTVAAINPIAGLVCKLVGIGLVVIGTAGQAYYGITSNRSVEWKLPDSLKRNGNGQPPMPPFAPQP